jgi:poly(A) polymerase
VNLKTYREENHTISKERIDQDALYVIHTLKDAGFEAFLVGGGVRDLLLQKTPKDFDISTSARPEEIKSIFAKKCLLIGKRFRLAHLRFGPKTLEVSTFRSGDPTSSSLIVRDNRWGTAEEDVMRRDFTINALFYDPTNGWILDYVGGYEDIQHKVLRAIGDPFARFKQDPVRMIRLLKFKARFDFSFESLTERALITCKEEIVKSAPARILEEVLKMLESGHAAQFFELMATYDFLEILFPCFHHFFSGPAKDIAYHYLKTIDGFHLKQNTTLDRGFLMAVLVFPILEQELVTLTQDRQAPLSFSDIIHLSNSLLRGISTSSFAHFPKKILAIAHSLITQQFRFTPLRGKPKWNARIHQSYEMMLALQFLNLRSAIDPELKEFYTGWKKAIEQK